MAMSSTRRGSGRSENSACSTRCWGHLLYGKSTTVVSLSSQRAAKELRGTHPRSAMHVRILATIMMACAGRLHGYVAVGCLRGSMQALRLLVIIQKNKEASLSKTKQLEVHIRREKYAPRTLRSTEARVLEQKACDPVTFTLLPHLQRNNSAGIFLTLYAQAKEGHLTENQTFLDISTVLSEQVRRATSANAKLKHGIRYPRDYLNFMTLMRSYGQQSAQQYAILSSQLGGPSPRTLWYELVNVSTQNMLTRNICVTGTLSSVPRMRYRNHLYTTRTWHE